MFQGETPITIDDKGRMSIPTAHRELISVQCNNRLVFTYNPFEPGCLWLYPVRDWEKVRDQVNALSNLVAVHRNLQLKLVGAATHCEVDANGRVLVPASQRSAAGLEKRRSCWAWVRSSSCGARRRTCARSPRRSARPRSRRRCRS
jgi:MraZ protein